MKPTFKFSHTMLLKLALAELKTNKAAFEKKMNSKLGLKDATLVERTTTTLPGTTPNGDPLHSKEVIWTTKSHNIKTTEYGTIKSVEAKPSTKPNNKPTVIVKKKRVIAK